MPVNQRRKPCAIRFVQFSLVSVLQFVSLPVWVSSGTALHAQTIKVKLVNGKSGQPIAKTCVNTWVGTERRDAMAIPLDNDGIAWLYLTDKDSEVNTQSQTHNCGDFGVVHPIAKYADTIRIVAGFAVCQPHAPDYSWLAPMEFSTQKILREGIVTENVCGKSTATPKPGEVVIFVRPLTWWEKLKQ